MCGCERLYMYISVAHVPLAARLAGDLPAPAANVRYCHDRESCTRVATTVSEWPPAVAGHWCIPRLDLHATPHRGCVPR